MKRIYSLAFLMLLALTACGRSGDAQIGYDSQYQAASVYTCDAHPKGTPFLAADGCNSCTCKVMSDGSIAVMCTQMACLSH